MVGCSVFGCKSNGQRKEAGVTFHAFPTEDETCKLWIAGTGKKNWVPNKHSRICSKHFEQHCFLQRQKLTLIKKFSIPTLFVHNVLYKPEDYEEHNRLRQDIIPEDAGCSDTIHYYDTIRSGNPLAVLTPDNTMANNDLYDNDITMSPRPNKHEETANHIKLEYIADGPTNSELPFEGSLVAMSATGSLTERTEAIREVIKIENNPVQSTNLEACRVCLAVDCKMFQLDRKLKQAYTQATGIAVTSYDRLPRLLCWECTSRVLTAVKLRARAKKARTVLTAILAKQGTIHMQDIRSVNRRRTKLVSSLTHEYFKNIQYFNMNGGHLVEIEKSDDFDDFETFESTDVDDEVDQQSEDDKINIDKHDVDKTDGNKPDGNKTDGNKPDSNKSDGNKSDANKGDVHKIDADKTEVSDQETVDDIKGVRDVESLNEIEKKNTNLKKPTKRIRQRKPKGVSKAKGSDGTAAVSKLHEYFTITTVIVEDAIAAVESRKHSEAYINARYKCGICYRGYSIKNNYDAHSLKHTEKFGNIECVICKFRYSSAHRLTCHMVSHHRKRYRCKQCDFVTHARTTAANHHKFHSGAVFKCQHCHKQFNKKTSYYSHMRVKHACSYACELCGHTFLSESGMEQHKRRRHVLGRSTIEGPHCATCDVTFASRDAYDTHLTMSSRHNNDNQRSIVNAYQSTPRSLDAQGRTRRRRPTRQPVTCELCGVTLESVHSYAYHFRKAHPARTRTQHVAQRRGAPAVCELCGKKFHCMASLKSHMPVHTGVGFKCDQCGKTFMGKFNLYVHRKLHEPARQTYPCEICEKQFSSSGNLKRHIRSHTNATPFECEACGKRVTTHVGLQSHIDHVHNGLPWPKRTRTRTAE